MKVYVASYLTFNVKTKNFRTSLCVFSKEKDCYEAAISKAIDIFLMHGCTDPSVPGFHFYASFNSLVNASMFFEALEVFNNWGDTLNDDKKYLNVSHYEVDPTTSSIEKVKYVAKPVTKPIDVPCKVCGRNVNNTEATCWNCGVSNPAIK